MLQDRITEARVLPAYLVAMVTMVAAAVLVLLGPEPAVYPSTS